MKTNFLFCALVALVALSAPAKAASSATVTADLNLRAGPSTQYPVVTVVPQSAPVQLYGCNANASWCDIAYGSQRGWASASYIRVTSDGTPVTVTPATVGVIGVPVVTYSRVYWDTYYPAYPWYRNWNVYYAPPPPNGAVTGASGCIGNVCGGARSVTGVNGNTVTSGGACRNGNCAGAKTVTAPGGATASKTGRCTAGNGCTVTRTGPRGNSGTRQRVRP